MIYCDQFMPTYDFQAFDQGDNLVAGSITAPDVEQVKIELAGRFKTILVITENQTEKLPEAPPVPKRRKVVYLFKALDDQDRIIEGSLFAPSVGVACQRLERMYREIISIREKAEKPIAEEEQVDHRLIRPDALSLAIRRLALSVEGGVSLVEALRTGARVEEGQLGTVFNRVALAVETGKPFSLALKEQVGVFDQALIAMVRAGEARGGLVQALRQGAGNVEKSLDIRKQCARVFAYPLGTVAVTLAILVLFVLHGLPLIRPLANDSSVPLPFLTEFLISFAQPGHGWGLGSFALLMVMLLLAMMAVFLSEVQRPAGGRWTGWLVRLPLVGELLRAEERAQALNTLAVLLEAGVHPSRIPRVAAASDWNPHLRDAFAAAAQSYPEMLTLCGALEKHKVFPPTTLSVLKMGERDDQLGEAARWAAQDTELELARRLQRLEKIVEPLAIFFAGTLMILVGAGAFIPMINLLLEL